MIPPVRYYTGHILFCFSQQQQRDGPPNVMVTPEGGVVGPPRPPQPSPGMSVEDQAPPPMMPSEAQAALLQQMPFYLQNLPPNSASQLALTTQMYAR